MSRRIKEAIDPVAVKIVTWNVNSLRAREDLVLDWMEEHDPDVVCMQETKLTDQEFPEDAFGDLDYDVVFCGQRAYNGVAIASHEVPADVEVGLPGDDKKSEKRLIAANVEGIRLVNVYVPNGKAIGSDKYEYKLKWLDRLVEYITEHDPTQPLVLCGDFNLCPEDRDAFDADERGEGLFCSPKERDRFRRLLDWGLTDAYRHFHPEPDNAYTWWDYRAGGWEKDHGMRIDHLLVTRPVLERATDVTIDKMMRGAEGPSDHVPVTLHL